MCRNQYELLTIILTNNSKMAVDGYVIQLDLSDIRELVTLLRRTSNSLNQLTKRVHQTGNIYIEDLEALRESYNKLWDTADEILSRLSAI